MHVVPIGTGWQWNNNVDAPTITPSVLIRSGHYVPSWQPGDECWCGKDYGFSCSVCHAVVTDGRVFYCPDSTHALSGQTVDLPDVSDNAI